MDLGDHATYCLRTAENIPECYHLHVELCISGPVWMFSTSAVMLSLSGQRMLFLIFLLRHKLGLTIDMVFITQLGIPRNTAF